MAKWRNLDFFRAGVNSIKMNQVAPGSRGNSVVAKCLPFEPSRLTDTQ